VLEYVQIRDLVLSYARPKFSDLLPPDG
jgi:hypothetical protein